MTPYHRKGCESMNHLESKKKKRRIINFSIVALCVVILLGVVLVDFVSNKQTDATLTSEEAQAQIDELIAGLPTAVAKCSKYVVENTHMQVLSVEPGDERNFVVKVKYDTVDVAAMYEVHKDKIFETAWNYAEGIKAEGKKVNATMIQIEVQKYILAQLESGAWKTGGEVDVYFYDVRAEKLEMYFSDDALNHLLGGYIAVKDDIKATTEITVGGETVSIASDNTFRNGINQCFGLDNYDAEKPDTSSPLQQKWNAIKVDFYKNFIEDQHWKYIVEGVGNTLALTGLSLLLGIVLGLFTAIVRVVFEKTDKLYYLDKICKLYVAIIRGTPLMVQLLIIYFVLLLPIGIEKFPAAVLCFGLNSGAYVSEIIRGGIMSVDQGQTEAGRSLGFGFGATMFYIIMPQAFKAVLPALCNEFITLLKETSVAFYIGVADLTRGGIKIRSITYSNFMPLIAIALIYLALVLVLTKLVNILERRLRKSER